MSKFQGLTDVFAAEAQPSPYAVAGALADYFESRGSYQDDLAVINLLNQKGYEGTSQREEALPGNTRGEKCMSSIIGHLQVYLQIGCPAGRQDIAALRLKP